MSQKSMQETLSDSYLSAGSEYLETLYDHFLQGQQDLPEDWQSYFDTLPPSEKPEVSHEHVKQRFINLKPTASVISHDKQGLVDQLIEAYRLYGHLGAQMNPLIDKKPHVSELTLQHYGLSEQDLSCEFDSEGLMGKAKLSDILKKLQAVYAQHIGIEYLHVTNPEERYWLQQAVEDTFAHITLTSDEKKSILENLQRADGLEKYLGNKYVAQKRFSLEGGDSLIPMLHELIRVGRKSGSNGVVIGMPHRGRLNVLVNVMGQSAEEVFCEFEGRKEIGMTSGDVKYHLGYTADVNTPEGDVHLSLAFNPSHLEIISPVILGSVRARQDWRKDIERREVMPIIMHGDAAFCGQGVVMETLAMSQTRAQFVGGAVHIVVNNQIGFTTEDPRDGRSSRYCTDVAKGIEAPVFHVNAEDPEAVVAVARLALAYRDQFRKDVVIDLVCYRRHGHNEADEPSGTQPLMYQIIKARPEPWKIYAERLISEQIITQAEIDSFNQSYKKLLDDGRSVIESIETEIGKKRREQWKRYVDQHDPYVDFNSSTSKAKMADIVEPLIKFPADFEMQKQVGNVMKARSEMMRGEREMDWGCAETLAYATLLEQGVNVRICGQDSQRGTFAHRHAVLHEQNTGKTHTPLLQISEKQGRFEVYNSLLSEAGALGFEYGYSLADPDTLVIWEAQFGDFANGAQVVVDQFISSAWQKWGRLSGLTMLLPHGYEGMGPEHSSARLERYLQLCAEYNMQVCVPSTPAQIFHLLRRQVLRPLRIPLIVMTPKSLLRHKQAVSSIDELCSGEFQWIIPDSEVDPKSAKRVVLCSGKVYYDLLARRGEQKDIAIIRIEQLYPFPCKELKALLAQYKQAKWVVWCQEEPKNQGAWYCSRHHIGACLAEHQQRVYAGRPSSAAPAVGYPAKHKLQQEKLVENALFETCEPE